VLCCAVLCCAVLCCAVLCFGAWACGLGHIISKVMFIGTVGRTHDSFVL
jgi:hypothetical protein